jgi:hypothetical protein
MSQRDSIFSHSGTCRISTAPSWDVFGCPPSAPTRRLIACAVSARTCRAPPAKWLDQNPRGAVIEIFHFELRVGAALPACDAWTLCLNAGYPPRTITRTKDQIVAAGESPRGHWLFFVKDF